jgi:hypothetical protein
LAQPPLFVPGAIPAFRLLEMFKKSRTHVALVVDEYGDVEGLVTLNDFFEDLARELDEVAPSVHELRAIPNRGQKRPVRDGLRDRWVRGLPLAQVLGKVPVRVVIHLQQDQAQLILLNKDALEFRRELRVIRKRELNRLEQHDQGRQPLLAINNLNNGILIRNDRLLPTVQADNRRHEMPLVRAMLQPINILKHILTLLRTPRIRALILRNTKQPIRQEIGQRQEFRLDKHDKLLYQEGNGKFNRLFGLSGATMEHGATYFLARHEQGRRQHGAAVVRAP